MLSMRQLGKVTGTRLNSAADLRRLAGKLVFFYLDSYSVWITLRLPWINWGLSLVDNISNIYVVSDKDKQWVWIIWELRYVKENYDFYRYNFWELRCGELRYVDYLGSIEDYPWDLDCAWTIFQINNALQWVWIIWGLRYVEEIYEFYR